MPDIRYTITTQENLSGGLENTGSQFRRVTREADRAASAIAGVGTAKARLSGMGAQSMQPLVNGMNGFEKSTARAQKNLEELSNRVRAARKEWESILELLNRSRGDPAALKELTKSATQAEANLKSLRSQLDLADQALQRLKADAASGGSFNIETTGMMAAADVTALAASLQTMGAVGVSANMGVATSMTALNKEIKDVQHSLDILQQKYQDALQLSQQARDIADAHIGGDPQQLKQWEQAAEDARRAAQNLEQEYIMLQRRMESMNHIKDRPTQKLDMGWTTNFDDMFKVQGGGGGLPALTRQLGELPGPAKKAEQALKGVDKETKSKPKDAKGAADAIGNLAETFKRFIVAEALYFGLRMITQGLQALEQQLVETVTQAAKLENLQRSFSNMFGSLEQGNKQLDETRKAAYDTGANFYDMADAERRMLSAGMSVRQVIPVMKSLTTVANAQGLTQEQVNNVYTAFGQIQEKGVAQAEEVRKQLSNRMIPALRMLAIAWGKTTHEVGEMMLKQQISAPMFFEGFVKGEKMMFGALEEIQKMTFEGVTTNLQSLGQEFQQIFGKETKNEVVVELNQMFSMLDDPQVRDDLKLLGHVFALLMEPPLLAALMALSSGLVAMHGLAVTFKDFHLADSFLPGDDINKAANDLEDLRLKMSEGLGFLGDDEWGNAIFSTSKAVDDLNDALTRLRREEQLALRTLDDRIEKLQKSNELLQQQKSLEDAISGIHATEKDLAAKQRLAIDIASSEGRSAGEALPDLEARLASQRRDLTLMIATNINKSGIDALQQQRSDLTRHYEDLEFEIRGLSDAIRELGDQMLIGSDLYNQYRKFVPGNDAVVPKDVATAAGLDPKRIYAYDSHGNMSAVDMGGQISLPNGMTTDALREWYKEQAAYGKGGFSSSTWTSSTTLTPGGPKVYPAPMPMMGDSYSPNTSNTPYGICAGCGEKMVINAMKSPVVRGHVGRAIIN